jgi:hypothetical protein
MSDLGLLSHQYRELAEVARQLRHWAVQVKRAYHDLPPADGDTEADLTAALSELSIVTAFLRDVVDLKDEGAWPVRWLEAPPVPAALVARLRETHSTDRSLYVIQLGRLVKRLDQGIGALTERDIGLLDEIIKAAGADANEVFRRLMRWA